MTLSHLINNLGLIQKEISLINSFNDISDSKSNIFNSLLIFLIQMLSSVHSDAAISFL